MQFRIPQTYNTKGVDMSIFRSMIKIISIGISAGILIGCGGGGDAGGTIDLAKYMPKTSVTKYYKTYEKYSRDEDERIYNSLESIAISEADGNTQIARSRMDGGEMVLFRTDTVRGESISTTLPESDTHDEATFTTDRFVDIGDSIFESNISVDVGDTEPFDFISTCKVKDHLEEFSYRTHRYTGDILKLECLLSTSEFEFHGELHQLYDLTYKYLKKDVGIIAEMGEHCEVEGLSFVDDRNLEDCDKKMYRYKLFDHSAI